MGRNGRIRTQRPSSRGGMTTSRELLINIFMSVFAHILTKLVSEIILSECRIVGALEGTRLELGVRLVTLQLYTYWYIQYSSSELQELQVLVCCLYSAKGWDHVATRCVCVPRLQLETAVSFKNMSAPSQEALLEHELPSRIHCS